MALRALKFSQHSLESEHAISERILTDIFDSCPLGIMRINADLQVTYANRPALEICGLERWEGLRVNNIVADKKNLLKAKDHFGKRLQGASEEYELEFTRHTDGKRIPVGIAAMPIKNTAGDVIGSVGIVRNLLLEKTRESLDDRAGKSETAQDIFRAIADEIGKLVAFDLCSISSYNEELTRARVLFSRQNSADVRWPTRWFEITSEAATWVRNQEIETVDDLKCSSELRWGTIRDRDVEKKLAPFCSLLRYPIVQKNRVIASISLLAYRKKAFDRKSKETLSALPLDKSLMMALSYLEAERLSFRNDLVDQLSKKNGANLFDKPIADLILRRLSEQYDWEGISIFKVNQQEDRFELQSQAGRPEFLLTQGYTQALNEGVLGEAYRRRKPIPIPDVHDPEFSGVFKMTSKETASELCIPIELDGEVEGVLNFEDSHRNAFSPEEVKDLCGLLKHVAGLMEQRKKDALANAAFNWTPSALFVINEHGRIIKVNPTAIKLLGYRDDELRGSPLEMFLEPRERVALALRSSGPCLDEFKIRPKSGRQMQVLLGASHMGEGIGTIVTIRDLTPRRRIEELDYLQPLFNDIATQTKTPLSLAFSWLGRLNQRLEGMTSGTRLQISEVLEKVVHQLKKVDITYDRLVLYAKDKPGGVMTNPVILYLGEVLGEIRQSFPASEAERIRISGDGLREPVRADLFQITFSLETLLSYAVRYVPEASAITVEVMNDAHDDRRRVHLAMHIPGSLAVQLQNRAPDNFLNRVSYDIALGERIIAAFVENNGGAFKHEETGEGITFHVILPMAARA